MKKTPKPNNKPLKNNQREMQTYINFSAKNRYCQCISTDCELPCNNFLKLLTLKSNNHSKNIGISYLLPAILILNSKNQ